ncbi:MAG TPA: SMC-Scp complex subunit ScpB [Methanothrix sp.]|jgi:segregation and condensation protein B|nr:SMC-Scp complex subunit ScpB [Methanothrix sp.]HOV81178.1 SMC-Scp complex subunit ScpB [Methanothrix sp.]HPC89011.1 SMC-Scp complex subunit ScpB [Methanothrix sp.]HQE86776.1 SMC-Scp complex subunit ScpB [Methanothrix sp.]HQI67405.1 SMC-Scp complex subunit ScpB [Methanothrix sp.]
MILTSDSQAKAVIEAALFASGKTLSLRELADLSGLSVERARAMAGDLAAEYAARGSGIEIKSIGEGYFMQVVPRLAGQVVSCAPKEIEAPLIRTLAIIAYKQPIKQSELVKIRGNKSYEHVRELEKRGLISAEKAGHTKLLTTTPGFADYFGIVSGDPQSIRKALLQDRILIGVSPMYESLARRLALDYIVVNPYRPSEEDIARLKEIDLLILAPGYAERVKENYSGRMMEAGVRTLSQLKESAEVICRTAGAGDVEPLAAEIDSLLMNFRQRAASARPVRPLTPMIEELARDLHITVQEGGLTAAPDSSGMEADILVPVHQPYDMDILERVVQRCEKILGG